MITLNDILSVKVTRNLKSSYVTINYYLPDMQRNRVDEIHDVPHKDFYTAINDLSPYLAKTFHSEKTNLFSATGFKFIKSGIIIITGKLIADNNKVIGIASPQIDLDDDSLGFEVELTETIENLCLESLMLLNGSKKGIAQLTIDDAIKDNQKDDLSEDEDNIDPNAFSDYKDKREGYEEDDENEDEEEDEDEEISFDDKSDEWSNPFASDFNDDDDDEDYVDYSTAPSKSSSEQ